jgi:putative transposase
MVESGRHLWYCMTYIDLNMVRAGVVKHPREWRWCGYDELVGARSKFLALEKKRILELVGGTSEDLARDYEAALSESLERRRLAREPQWTEAIAVGSEDYVKAIAEKIRARLKVTFRKTNDGASMVCEPVAAEDSSLIRDVQSPSGPFSALKIERMSGFHVLKWG